MQNGTYTQNQREIGEKYGLGEAVLEALEHAEPITADKLSIRSGVARLPLRAPSKEEVERRIAEFTKAHPDKPLPTNLATLKQLWKDGGPMQDFEINAVMLDNEWLMVIMDLKV